MACALDSGGAQGTRICLASQVFGAKFFNVETAGVPAGMRIFGECMRIDAFDRSQPAKRPDAPGNPTH